MTQPDVRISPSLIAEWDDDLTYIGVGKYSKRKINWKCSKCQHKWKTSVSSRTRGSGCPICSRSRVNSNGENSLLAIMPNLAEEWCSSNEIGPEMVTKGSNKKVNWKCKVCNHKWSSQVHVRTKGSGCPVCAGKCVHSNGYNSLESLYPKISEELFDEEYNANELLPKSNRKVRWKCSKCNHIWFATVTNRTDKNSKCPSCSGRTVHSSGRDSLESLHPRIASELFDEKYHSSELLPKSNQRLRWKCSSCSHLWKTTVAHRLEGNNCPACSNRQVHIDGRNSMRNTNPRLADELMPNKYGDANNLTAGTAKKLPWKCTKCGHEWITSASHRTHIGTGCPTCAETGFNPDLPAYYYVLKFTGVNEVWFYKGGITNAKVEFRIRNIKTSLKRNNLPLEVGIVERIHFDLGNDAKEFEDKLKNIENIRAVSLDKFEGATELFNVNPLEYARENGLLKNKSSRQANLFDF